MEKTQSKAAAKRKLRKAKIASKREKEFEEVKGDLPQMSEHQIINAFKNAQSQDHSKVLAAVNRLESKISKMSQGYVAQKAFKKANVGGLKALKAKLISEGVDISDITDRQLEQLVALDDWSSIMKVAWPLIQQFGAPILKSLYNKHIQPKIDKFMGGDEGINPADWGGVLGPFRFTPAAGENFEIPGIKSVEQQSGRFDCVDPKSIASTIAPELYKHRYSFVETMRSSLANVSAEYSIVTNSSGQVGVSIQSLNSSTAGSTYLNSYLTVFNDSTFTVSSGNQTVAATYNAGPLYGATASIDSIRTTNFSMQVIPTASFNTAGAFTLGYNNRWGSSQQTSLSLGVNLAQLKTFPYVTSFNNKTSVRMINVTGDTSDDNFYPPSSAGQHQYFVLLGSGLPASTEVARIVVTAVAEFIPNVASLPICVMDYPRIGPMTENFESMMFMRFPVLQQLDLIDAKKVTDALPSDPTPFNTLFAILSAAISGIQPRQYVSHIAGPDIALPGESVEFAID